MEVHTGSMLAARAAWLPVQKQCYSDNASSESSITETAVHLQPLSPQRVQLAHGRGQRPHDHSSVDSETTDAQLPQSVLLPSSPANKSSDGEPLSDAQRVSSRLRKRQRAAAGPGDMPVYTHA